METLTHQIFVAAFFIFLGYYVVLAVYYLILGLVGFAVGHQRGEEDAEEDYRLLAASSFTLPVSIILPAHNEEAWIADSLQSLLNLNYPEFEIVVVDDCSTDRTLEILKERLELVIARMRLDQQRLRGGYGPQVEVPADRLKRELDELKSRLAALDNEITPLARGSAELGNAHWGPLLRAGNDKSHLARQIERSADAYTSRVSNFLYVTPFGYLRSPRGSLPHDPEVVAVTADPDRGGEGG